MSKRHGTNRRWLSITQKLDQLHPRAFKYSVFLSGKERWGVVVVSVVVDRI
jgi:hypothetical protein